MDIGDILSQPGRTWSGRPGADEAEIEALVAASAYPIPAPILELLRFSNGGEGELALPPMLLVLDPVRRIIAGLDEDEEYSGLVFIGGNGGLERIALDFRVGEPYPIVTIDPVAGLESAVMIATDADEFVQAIGLMYDEQSSNA